MITFSYILMTLLMFAGLFLIGLILLQRGRGGGLAGAFGGMGGQSAFGTKAGDVFTRITIGVAAAWILLCAGNVIALHNAGDIRAKEDLFKKDEPAAAQNVVIPKAGANANAAGGALPAPSTTAPAGQTSQEDAKEEATVEKKEEPAAEPAKAEAAPADAPKASDAAPPAAEKPADANLEVKKDAEPKPETPAEPKPQ